MADKVITLTMKSLKENINRKDIKKAVVDLKDIVDELEHISKETDIDVDKDKDEKNPTKRKIYLSSCSLCKEKFENISSLEKHIKTIHKEYQSYECDDCSKKFVTKFRLEKHLRMHSRQKS